MKRNGDGRDKFVTCRRKQVRSEQGSWHETLTRELGRRRAQKAAIVSWLPVGRGRLPTNDTARQSVSISIMPHVFNTNTICGCPRPGAGIERGCSTRFWLSLIGWLSCPGLGEAAALDMLESCAEEGP